MSTIIDMNSNSLIKELRCIKYDISELKVAIS